MSRIAIQVDAVRNTNRSLDREIARLKDIKENLTSLIYQIDPDILARRNIRSRLNNAVGNFNLLEMKIRRLQSFIDYAMDGYCAADNYVNNKFNSLHSVQTKHESFNSFTVAKKVYKYGWKGLKDGVISIISYSNGYKLRFEGNYVYVYGKRSSRFFDKFYKNYRASGTRYLLNNSAVAKYYKPGAAVKNALGNTFNPAKLKGGLLKGSGLLGPMLYIGDNVYSYGWGEKSKDGIASTEFASSLTVDMGIVAGTTAVSAGTSAIAGAISMSVAGSVVPGFGTVVGFGVGLLIGWALETQTGKAFVGKVKGCVNNGFENIVEESKEIGTVMKHSTDDIGSGIRNIGNSVGKYLGGRQALLGWR